MSVVITSPSAGIQETASKNWYRAEALRKIKFDLVNVFNDADDSEVRQQLSNAIIAIDVARCILNPSLRQPAVKPETKSKRATGKTE